MDYNYQLLQQQIKALMNKTYVPTSSHAKVSEEIVNGSCNLLIDTVQKYFVFKYAGVNDPIYIDPVNKRLLNVKFIGDVDVTKLITAIQSGYGINIEDMGEGVYKIGVKDDLFATKDDIGAVEDRFDDYTTTDDLVANHATKSEMNALGREIDERPTYAEVAKEYAKIESLNEISKRLDDD